MPRQIPTELGIPDQYRLIAKAVHALTELETPRTKRLVKATSARH
jgi:hypothetical protein